MRRLGVVAIVVVGLLMIGGVFGSLASIGTLFGPNAGSLDTGQRALVAFSLGAACCALALGLGLIIMRESVSTRLFGDDDADVITVDGPDLMRVAIATIGVWLVAVAIPALVLTVSNVLLQRLSALREVIGPESWLLATPSVFVALMRLLVGLGLIWLSKPLSRVVFRERRAVVAVASHETCACPECGAPYDPADYREGVERRCAACHSPLDASE